MRREQEDLVSVLETPTAISRSTSVRSCVSGVTSLHSMHSSIKYHMSHRAREDLLSEVPAISESVADMDDLGEWEDATTVTVIDNRQHPLAPSNISMYSAESRLSTNTPVIGDLGASSDVPDSFRDDASVNSALSEIGLNLNFRNAKAGPSKSRGRSKESDRLPDDGFKLGGMHGLMSSRGWPAVERGASAPVLRETELCTAGLPPYTPRRIQLAGLHAKLNPTLEGGLGGESR